MPTTLAPPKAFDPRLVCRGMLTPWPSLDQAIKTLADSLPLLNGVTPVGQVPIGSRENTLSALGNDPIHLTGESLPDNLYSQVLWGASKTAAAAGKISAFLLTIKDIADTDSSVAPADLKALLEGPGGLCEIANAANTAIGKVAVSVKGDAAMHADASAGLAQAMSDLAALGEESEPAPVVLGATHISEVLRQVDVLSTQTSARLKRLNLAAQVFTVTSVLDNMAQALATLQDGWVGAAANFKACADEIAAHPDKTVAELLQLFGLDAAQPEWNRFDEECQLLVVTRV